jgi:hypothetical protein
MNVWPEVVREAALIPGVTVLSAPDATALSDRFADAFVADPKRPWWWEALREGVATEVVDYGEADAAWPLLHQWLPERRYVLLVTDEEPVPAGAVSGRLDDLDRLAGECWLFEYVITDEAASFGVFDTHHNALIRVGALPR